jgi:hypothetical protein
MALGRLYGRRFVAVAAPSELRSAARLRSDLRAAGLRVWRTRLFS